MRTAAAKSLVRFSWLLSLLITLCAATKVLIEDPKEKWVASENLASYYGITKITSITLPVHVNLFFIGFDGDGQNGIRISNHAFEEWFDHLEHSMEQYSVPLGDEPPHLKRLGAATKLHVRQRFMTRIVKVSPLVNTIIEDAIMYHLRPEDPNYDPKSTETTPIGVEADKFYIDAFKFSSLLVSLVRDLRLQGQNGYSLFILNPKSPINVDQKYGYRVGFSHHEIDTLFNSTAFDLPDSIHSEFFKRRGDEELKHQDYPQDNSYQEMSCESLVASKSFHLVYMTTESQKWAEDYVRRVVKGENSKEKPVACVEEDDPLCGFKNNKADAGKMNIIDLAKQIAAVGTQDDKRNLYKVWKFAESQAECLVDQWISHSRVAFVDLTAGPFEWGPILARQGLKNFASLPRVNAANLDELRFEQEDEKNIHTKQQDQEESKPEESKAIEIHHGKDVLSSQEGQEMSRWQAIRDQALSDAREAYVVLCGKRSDAAVNQAECDEMAQKLKDLEREVHLWTSDDIDGDIQHAPFALDAFMSKLGALISKTFSQLIARPLPSFPTPFAEKIIYDIHLILGQTTYDALGPLHFNIQEFKHELKLLKLQNQAISFEFKKHSIRDNSDPRLATAIQHALRTETVPRMSINGLFSHPVVTFLDANELQVQFRQLFQMETRTIEAEIDPESRALLRIVRKIPIFIISLDTANVREEPILIDRYHVARGMSDMVIVVQSNQSMYETRWHCNKESIFWNLRNPVRQALAATALTTYGLIPSHFQYDPAHESLVKDHLWSVGNNPFSGTSHGSHFSGFHRDAAIRSTISQALHYAVLEFNSGVSVLKSIQTSAANFKGTSFLPIASLLADQKNLFGTFKRISSDVELLNWEAATEKLRSAQAAAAKFHSSAKSILEMMDIYKCMVEETATHKEQRTTIWNFFFYPLAICAYLFAILLYCAFKGKKKKMKQV